MKKSKRAPKAAPDGTIYRTKDGMRVRIVKPKEVHVRQVDAWVHKLITDNPTFVVASVRDGKRRYGYKKEDLTPE